MPTSERPSSIRSYAVTGIVDANAIPYPPAWDLLAAVIIDSSLSFSARHFSPGVPIIAGAKAQSTAFIALAIS